MAPTASEYAALVLEARSRELPSLIKRQDIITELPEPAAFNTVHIITGVRRCGKTFYAFQLMNRLLGSGVSRDAMLYFDFSDDRLQPLSATAIDDVLNEYWRQVPQARSQGCYLFLDEIQEVENWQGTCRRLAEHERITLVITGSSSKLSADELGTNFRGRSLDYPMAPLSFREFCLFRGIDVPQAAELASTGAVSPTLQTELEHAYDDYLLVGGFPGVQSADEPVRIRTLQTYVRDIVTRDVMERAGRFELALANQIALFCLRNTGCDLSINNLVENMKAVGFKTSWETVSSIVRLFEQAHLIDLLPEYATALASKSTAQQKVYAVDAGMALAVSRANQQDIGKRLETAVYREIKRRLFGYRTEAVTSYTAQTPQREKIDFLIGDALGMLPYRLYQVTVSVEADRTRRREIGSLSVAMQKTDMTSGTIITLRERDELETSAGTIHVVPAWLWSLCDENE